MHQVSCHDINVVCFHDMDVYVLPNPTHHTVFAVAFDMGKHQSLQPVGR